MKYAAIKETIVDFDISKGNTYQETILWFDTEKELIHHFYKCPNDRLIRYEDISMKLVSESDLNVR